MNLFWFPIEHIIIIIVILLIAFSVHECAHAWTAYKFGDNTAYREGRVTLNPMAHLDWMGTLFLIIAGFGWAKPVPVDRRNFARPRLMSFLVTAAGPFSNLLLAFLILLLLNVLVALHLLDGVSNDLAANINTFVGYWLRINMVLLLFNLIPVPPLDGFRMIEEFLPVRWRIRIQQAGQWIMFGFLIIVFVPPLRRVTIGPLLDLSYPIIRGMAAFLDLFF